MCVGGWCTGVVRACTDGAANVLYDCRSTDMQLPTLISGDFDSLRCDVLNYYDNIVKVFHSAFAFTVRVVQEFVAFRAVSWLTARVLWDNHSPGH